MALEFDWVEVPTGVVVRGTPAESLDSVVERHRDLGLPHSYFMKETPQAEVPVDRFRICRTTVTTGQWNAFCGATGEDQEQEDPRLPAEDITWSRAVAFCRWASSETGVEVRLPQEVEWERAARGDDVREFPWGDNFEPRRANLVELGIGHRLPVGSLPLGASAFGLLDMAGNVDEWTSTEYSPYAGAMPDVPRVDSNAFDSHITRGGGYEHRRDLARCARRHGIYQVGRGAGFRVVAS